MQMSAKWIMSATTPVLQRQLAECAPRARLGDTTAKQTVRAIEGELEDRALQMEELERCLAHA